MPEAAQGSAAGPGACVWFTGLSGAGKSTTAEALVARLRERGREVTFLDGDVVRTHLSRGLGFSREDRDLNVRRIGFVAAEVVRHGGLAVAAVVSPYRATRDEVRQMVGPDRFVEVFVDTPLEVAEQRDVKGWYARARAGEVTSFTGLDDPYEPPALPELTLRTEDTTAEANAELVLAYLVSRGFLRSGAGASLGRAEAFLADPRLAGLLSRLGEAVPEGLQVVASDRLVARPFDPGMALLILPAAAAALAPSGAPEEAPAPLPGRHGHGADPADLLRRLYPADHPVLAASGDRSVGALGSADLRSEPVLLPALDELGNAGSPHGLAWLVARLRQPDGCPWDREQDHLSLRPFLLEEAYEVYDALEGGASPVLAEELGDLLLQVVLHAQYAAEEGIFDLADVQRAVMAKIVRRHPHVFGDVEVATAADVLRNWEQLKAAERNDAEAATTPAEMPAAFAGLSSSLPALAYAGEMQARAASLGYDWPDLEGVIDKIAEEASELLAADAEAHRREELGDLLFVIVNLGRKLGIDAEGALRAASRKFAARFARVERLAEGQGLELRALGLDALDELWQEAKRQEGP